MRSPTDPDSIPLGGDLPAGTWTCPRCRATNSNLDVECQFCPDEPDYAHPLMDDADIDGLNEGN